MLGGVAGCLSDVLPGQDTPTPVERSLTKTIAEGHVYMEGSNLTKIEYTVRVLDGPRIDVLVVDQSGWEDYENQNFDQFSYYEHLSETHTAFAEATGEFGERDFYGLIIDNTDNIGASPSGDGAAVVEIDLAKFI